MKSGKYALPKKWVWLLTVACSLACMFLVGWFYSQPSLLLVLLAANSALIIWIGRPKEDVLLYCIVAAFGPVAEAISISYGAWAYAGPFAFGLPYWLPLVWGTAAVFIKRAWEAIDWLRK